MSFKFSSIVRSVLGLEHSNNPGPNPKPDSRSLLPHLTCALRSSNLGSSTSVDAVVPWHESDVADFEEITVNPDIANWLVSLKIDCEAQSEDKPGYSMNVTPAIPPEKWHKDQYALEYLLGFNSIGELLPPLARPILFNDSGIGGPYLRKCATPEGWMQFRMGIRGKAIEGEEAKMREWVVRLLDRAMRAPYNR